MPEPLRGRFIGSGPDGSGIARPDGAAHSLAHHPFPCFDHGEIPLSIQRLDVSCKSNRPLKVPIFRTFLRAISDGFSYMAQGQHCFS